MLVRNFIFWLSFQARRHQAIARPRYEARLRGRFVAGETLAKRLPPVNELCSRVAA